MDTNDPTSKPSFSATEPARLIGAVTAVVTGLFALLASLGLTYSADLPGAITGLIVALVTLAAIVVPLWQAETTRGKVSPAGTVKAITAIAAVPVPAPAATPDTDADETTQAA